MPPPRPAQRPRLCGRHRKTEWQSVRTPHTHVLRAFCTRLRRQTRPLPRTTQKKEQREWAFLEPLQEETPAQEASLQDPTQMKPPQFLCLPPPAPLGCQPRTTLVYLVTVTNFNP